MKRYSILILVLLLFLSGCGKGENTKINMNFDDKYYDIAIPYKTGVGNNYVRPSVITAYDYSLVDDGLMDISVKYFNPDNVKLQAGQYLTEALLTDLLSDKKLNKVDKVNIDGIELKPNYIVGIHEQDFLNNTGALTGVSLALVLNPYQEYQNSNGTYLYKALSIENTINYGQKQAQKLLNYLRQIDQLAEVKIMMTLYVIANPNETSSGNFEYVGVTDNDKIDFNNLDYQYQYLTSNYVLESDLNNYTAFRTLVKNIQNEADNLYITAKGLYVNNQLNKVEITVNSSLLTKNKLLMITQLFGEEIAKQFDERLLIKVYFKINNETKALVVKKRDNIESNIYLLT